MKDIERFVRLIKQTAVDVYNANIPVSIVYGKIKTTSPITIEIEQKLIIPESAFIVGATIKPNLAVGDIVILLRQQGGQSYLVIDKKG